MQKTDLIVETTMAKKMTAEQIAMAQKLSKQILKESQAINLRGKSGTIVFFKQSKWSAKKAPMQKEKPDKG